MGAEQTSSNASSRMHKLGQGGEQTSSNARSRMHKFDRKLCCNMMDPRVLFVAGLLLTGSVPCCNARCCDGDSWFSLTNLVVGAATGVGAVLAAPVVLSAAGFTSAGVALGSFAAVVQGPAVVSGSAFALAQSAGAAGLGVGAKAALFMGGAAAGSAASKKK
ncbi:hypothetical protein MAR_032474 [Mya arenaria]|uniref:Uncharacterized protein n=1 Tax=Mya arenaria TaxID=6604 RepID=A0ABY7F6V9_MYAAR|nr:hypothetical protein MAR_032474 [Mya arenaria]